MEKVRQDLDQLLRHLKNSSGDFTTRRRQITYLEMLMGQNAFYTQELDLPRFIPEDVPGRDEASRTYDHPNNLYRHHKDFGLVTYDDTQVRLTPTENLLLTFMEDNLNIVVSHMQILDFVWGISDPQSAPIIKAHISHLRRKVPSLASHIQSANGFGYRLVDTSHLPSNLNKRSSS